MLREIIIKSGKTQTHWAREIGVSKSYLSDLLNGKRVPALDLAARIERLTDGAVMAASWSAESSAPQTAPENQEDAA
jgi:transcriptional regulator with XRE-family HTH domain